MNKSRKQFSKNKTNLTTKNGTEYVPFFVKGANLRVSVPVTFPDELVANRNQYNDGVSDIKEACFNCIRICTLHYPIF